MERTPTPRSKPETYLYHMVPADMEGTVLHPLNTLKDTHPELYESKASKYEDRQHVMEQFIPTLECAWNDVVHLTAIHPAQLKQALVEAGMSPREMKFYQIDPHLLDPEKTTIYLYQDKTNDDKMNSENFAAYNPETLAQYAELPTATKTHYKEKYSKGEKPLLFVGVPHILHKGSIDISNAPVLVV